MTTAEPSRGLWLASPLRCDAEGALATLRSALADSAGAGVGTVATRHGE